MLENVPCLQGIHRELDDPPVTLEKVPLGHFKHMAALVAAIVEENVPVPQGKQVAGLLAPNTLENVPAAQETQVELELAAD